MIRNITIPLVVLAVMLGLSYLLSQIPQSHAVIVGLMLMAVGGGVAWTFIFGEAE